MKNSKYCITIMTTMMMMTMIINTIIKMKHITYTKIKIRKKYKKSRTLKQNFLNATYLNQIHQSSSGIDENIVYQGEGFFFMSDSS